MKLREVPFWLVDRDCDPHAYLLDHEVELGWTQTQEHTAPFNDRITFMMVPLYMEVGRHAFPPVIMVPEYLDRSGHPAYSNGWRQLSGAHRLRAAFLAGHKQIPAYLVQPQPDDLARRPQAEFAISG